MVRFSPASPLHLPTLAVLTICVVAALSPAYTLGFDHAVAENIDSMTGLADSTPRKLDWDLRLCNSPPTASSWEPRVLDSQPMSELDSGSADGVLLESTADGVGVPTYNEGERANWPVGW